MLIEIRKAGFVNKGAELMLYAVLQKISKMYPDAKFVMAPDYEASYENRARCGLLQKAWLWRYGIQWGDFLIMAPKKLRKMYGIVLDRDIDVVLDAAGFSYTDQWGDWFTQELAKSCRRWRKIGTKVILLPQAFGPFKSSKIREAIKTVADNADMIFTREHVSYNYLIDVVGHRTNIKIAPDFTNLINGILPNNFNSLRHQFCIVPNYRMLDKTSPKQGSAYLPFMIKCVKYLAQNKLEPFLLVHEGPNDLRLANKIMNSAGVTIPIIAENDPLFIKGILGSCTGCISSRFHALINCLDQGVPALAVGWSHKYKLLMDDYGFPDGCLDVMADENEIYRKIDMIMSSPSRNEIQTTITESSLTLKQLTENMWKDVNALINAKKARGQYENNTVF